MKLNLTQRLKSVTLTHANLFLVMLTLVCVIFIQRHWQSYQMAQTALRQQAHQSMAFDQQKHSIIQLAEELGGTIRFAEEDPSLMVALQIVDSKSLPKWQSLFARLQQHLWLEVESMQWQRDIDHPSHWQADIVWQFRRPATLKPEQNWLPIDVINDKQTQGQLLTILNGGRPAALMQVDQTEQWAHEGSWLPNLRATIEQITGKGVTLRYVSGEAQTLLLAHDADALFTLGGD